MTGWPALLFTDTRITLKLVNQHLFKYQSELKNDPNSVNEDLLQWVACIEKDFLHETLTLTFLTAGYGETLYFTSQGTCLFQ
ncbi:hypothetical protein [Desulfobacter curvatus]|uniref:hypothetical protein n=1 Tax=Desulfobacter curvatus TaxID=2290 RepID=UPI000373DD19|nr:hypothetical protein [Desulfobacter curvatus]